MKIKHQSLINTIIGMMDEREKAKSAKQTRNKYRESNPDLTIDTMDYCIKANLWLLQSLSKKAPGELDLDRFQVYCH